jgi:hypothetical protein
MLRISHRGIRKHIALGVSSSLALWDTNINAPKKKHPNKDYIEMIMTQAMATYQYKLIELRNQGKVITPHLLAQAVAATTEAPAVPTEKEASKVLPFFD